MIKEFGIKNEKIFKVVVVATMSSGKSTFINALLGKDLLLSRNEACSAQVISILDNDKNQKEIAYVLDDKKQLTKYDDVTNDVMEKINTDNTIDKVLIETELGGIKNTDRAMLIVDTPGVNNSMDLSHKEKTMNLLNDLDEGLIVYLINATQIGIDDDCELLKTISDSVKKSAGRKKIIFVVNKIDELDEEKESIGDCIKHIESYLKNNGITNPQIYPVSALSCKLFRMAQTGAKFTRRERMEFVDKYDYFKSTSYNLNRYIISDKYSNKDKEIEVGTISYKYIDLYLAINNTGIPAVEHTIEDIMAKFGDVYNPQILIETDSDNSNNTDYSYITYDGFKIDNNVIVRCPKGNAPMSNTMNDKEIIARFKKRICASCDNRKKCGIKLQSKSAIKIVKEKKNGSKRQSVKPTKQKGRVSKNKKR